MCALDPPHTPRALAQEVGLKVSDVVVLIDRQQGGEAHLASKARAACLQCGVRRQRADEYRRRGGAGPEAARGADHHADAGHAGGAQQSHVSGGSWRCEAARAALGLTRGRCSRPEVAASVRAFIAENQTVVPASAAAVSGNVKAAAPKRLAYGARAAQAANPAGAAWLRVRCAVRLGADVPIRVRCAGKQLLEIMERKQTNLCVAADVTTCAGVLALADAIGARCAACDACASSAAAELRAQCQARTFAASRRMWTCSTISRPPLATVRCITAVT